MPGHNVYVVELSRDVLLERGFAAANPQHRADKPCVYVGMTGLQPEERFANHKRGYRASRLVKKYGVRLRPRLYSSLNPMSYDAAVEMERHLASKLRKRGYAVWQN